MTDWTKAEPIERRARLNELAAQGYDETLTDDEKAEHDILATMVAQDEDNAERAENGNSDS